MPHEIFRRTKHFSVDGGDDVAGAKTHVPRHVPGAHEAHPRRVRRRARESEECVPRHRTVLRDRLPPESLPEIPFSLEELKRAKALNHFLILRLDRFTPKELEERYNSLHANPEEPLLFNTNWYQNEPFYTQDKPKLSWALVSREVLPNSTDKNYLAQTQELIHYLKNQVYKDQPPPPDFNTWVAEFDSQKAALAQLITSNWQEAARKLSKLAINQHYRPSFADSLYDLAIYQRTHNQRLLPNLYAWTRSRSSDGSLVDVGPFRSSGLIVYGLRPVYHDTGLGLLVARSQ